MTMQDAILSSGTLATLTGIDNYDILDRIQTGFLAFIGKAGQGFKNWQEAWTKYREEAELDRLAEEIADEGEAFTAYLSNLGTGSDDLEKALEDFRDAYMGTFDSLTEWAEDYADSTGMLESIPDHLRCYFDFQAFARDADINGDVYGLDLEGGQIAVFHGR